MYILAFGDSITYGAFDFDNGGWIQRLRIFLDQKIKSDPDKYFFIVYNLGIDGHTTQDWLPIFKGELETRMKIVKKYNEPAVIILALGGNDASFIVNKNRNKVSEDKFKNNIKRFIKISRKSTKNIILLGISPCEPSKNPAFDNGNLIFKNEYIIRYNKILKSVSEEENIKFIDIFDKIKNIKDFTSFDGAHLNSEGHKIIFETVKDFLIKNKII